MPFSKIKAIAVKSNKEAKQNLIKGCETGMLANEILASTSETNITKFTSNPQRKAKK